MNRHLAIVVAATSLAAGDALAQDMELVQVSSGLAEPLLVISAPGDASRLFIVEQNTARIRVRQANGTLSTFLDLGTLAGSGGEQGLLGMAFDPAYWVNGRFYVNYTDNAGDTVVARYTVSGNPDVADPNSALTIIAIDQPFSNHNGGMLAFDPDGMLMIGMGDGGSGGDPAERAQNPMELLGKMLRLDVTNSTQQSRYAIPADNPFVNDPGTRDEIWALGVRNPWRFSFDRLTGDLWIGDVGQNNWEEVSFEPAGSAGGLNFGWDIMEGEVCHEPLQGCNQAGLTLPVHTYSHAFGCSITGGYVYRGGRMPWLEGRYLFADYCSHRVWALTYDGIDANVLELTSQLDPFTNVTSFGEDADGNVYVVGSNGGVWVIASALRLQVNDLVAGQDAIFDIAGASPGERVYVAYSLSGPGNTYLAPLDVTVNLANPSPVGSANANGSGEATITVTLPPQASGRDVWFQAVVNGNASNVWSTTVQ